jgi:hypothetical protein
MNYWRRSSARNDGDDGDDGDDGFSYISSRKLLFGLPYEKNTTNRQNRHIRHRTLKPAFGPRGVT